MFILTGIDGICRISGFSSSWLPWARLQSHLFPLVLKVKREGKNCANLP